MAFPMIVHKRTPPLYKNNENILSFAGIEVSWDGDKPLFFVTNEMVEVDESDVSVVYEEIALTTSGASISHTFTNIGTSAGWKVVFVRGKTTITNIKIARGASMTGVAKLNDLYLDISLERTLSDSPTRSAPSQIKASEDTTTPLVTDTDMPDPRPIKGEEVVDDFEATTGWTPNGTNSVAVNTSIFQRGSGSVELIKSDTGDAVASMSKTVTSLDFTDKELVGFFNVSATLLADLATSPATLGGAVEIRYGSDSSNYYSRFVAQSAIVEGRNVYDMTSSDADLTTGSPVLTAMDYLEIMYETNNASDTSATGDFTADEAMIASSDDFFKGQQSGYPKFNYTSKTGTIRSRMTVNEGVGFLFTRLGHFNTDGTPLMATNNLVDAVSKSATDELILSETLVHERKTV